MKRGLLLTFILLTAGLRGQSPNVNTSHFRQMKDLLPTPNMYRTGGGAPGAFYYQQQANYKMKIRLDDENQRIYGEQTITYINNAPESLEYLWVQLDQNMRAQNSLTQQTKTGDVGSSMSTYEIEKLFYDFDGGFKIDQVKDQSGQDQSYKINYTMMRINLDAPLQSGDSVSFSIKWWYNINDRAKLGGRSGLEYFEDEDNYLYTIAQFFPRMAVYNDVEGWQNKQFLGRGEFALPFGNYDVEITAPADHIVGATGTLQNSEEVLSKEQLERLEEARNNTEDPVFIVNEMEARKAEGKKEKGEKTWHFKAHNVRDFAFCSSRKFIWDAMAVKFGDRTVLAMSYYPKEGNPLWERYSTRVVAHTIKTYSKFTFDYPYPVAISVHTDRIGMEYPMICFNGGRPQADGTYSKNTKYGMIGVIIHEVGHNFFPMIVNSDERQWTWMDEGLNTFVQYLTEQEWEENYPSRRGPAYKIADYMRSEKQDMVPIMTNSESILQFGNNAYGKPATALNILRETVMGRELFDYSFKTYCQRWMFKHPTPADFFRTMEDASATDLDWFFRGWFYTTDNVDIALKEVKWYRFDTKNPDIEKARERKEAQNEFIGDSRNSKELKGKHYSDAHPEMADFYNKNDDFTVLPYDREQYKKYRESLSEEQKKYLDAGWNFYEIEFENQGGLVMPVILRFTFADGSTEVSRHPAEIWIQNELRFKKVFVFEKEVVKIELDPFLETADTDLEDNVWPEERKASRFEIYRSRNYGESKNRMQQAGK
ncbi:M1 family metallopeptidase [Croceimicrobium hydrocarbonivorans]|uniref:M1 family metallopeptidase n=1 Tax=Croceimicrobium hydrocarbonivorans TaxID=2761580 RepID=A0A7H0VCC9_9FLAO|nr:M1 family metallopeptidase [Croceimicrobium hydrocarbonivorans]QNR23377.1 M1 family metallopeptidase [Croceimicrobium hydrocarbonivorans]